jgi:hypothetical protein
LVAEGDAAPLGSESRLTVFHLEVLPEAERQALATLAPVATRSAFYLAGGTAVALRLGHRQSLDFDFFTADPIEDPLALAERLRSQGLSLETQQVATGTLHAKLNGVRVSFLSYGYPLLSATSTWREFSCELASLDDLACMKLAAVAQRGARKDFLDVFAIGTSGLSLSRMLDLYQKKYGTRDIGHVLAGLCYFDDAERDPMPIALQPVDWAELKTTLRAWVSAAAG